MPGVQLVFTGVDAFVSVVTGPTTVRFFIDENEFDQNKLIDVDLAKNPQTIAPAGWAQNVDCDHQLPGGRTTIGPQFNRGAHVGGVYLSQRLVTKYATVLASWPPAPDAIYQYQLVLRSGNGEPARYHGFKVKVLSPGVGTLAHVAFYRIAEATPSYAQWLDLADPDVCDAAANGFTKIVPTSPVGTVDALFLSSKVIALDGPNYPKWPRGYGL